MQQPWALGSDPFHLGAESFLIEELREGKRVKKVKASLDQKLIRKVSDLAPVSANQLKPFDRG
jgi:hypothetical protein